MAKKTARESILQEKTVRRTKAVIPEDARFKVLKRVSIISIVVIVAICLLFNILLSLTLDRKLTFDSSSVNSNSISAISKEYLKNMDKKVEIIGLFDKNDTSIEWRDYFLPILEDYEDKADGKLTVSYIDPALNPYIFNELDPDQAYGVQELCTQAGGAFFFRCGENQSCLNPYSCFTPDSDLWNMYQIYKLASNDVELYVTGNIMYVTSDNPLHAYYLTGHQEATSHTSMDALLKSHGFQYDTLNLGHQNSVIPDDCDLILILQPMQDITDGEKEQLKLFLNNGGKMIVVSDYDYNSNRASVVFSNLNEVTRTLGISMDNAILHEQDTNYLLHSDDPYNSLVVVNPALSDSFNTNVAYTSAYNRYISVFADKSDDVVVTPLLQTSEKTSVDFQNMSIGSNVTINSYPVMMLGSFTDSSNKGKLLVIGTQTFTSDEYYGQKTLQDANADFIRSMIDVLCPASMNVSIPAKTIPNYSLQKTLSSNEITIWSIVVMTVIPLGCLIIGGVVYKKRRHL